MVARFPIRYIQNRYAEHIYPPHNTNNKEEKDKSAFSLKIRYNSSSADRSSFSAFFMRSFETERINLPGKIYI
jgi:hypothetical protein